MHARSTRYTAAQDDVQHGRVVSTAFLLQRLFAERSLRDQLHCQNERSNDKDRHTIAVVDNGDIAHLLLVYKRGGIIESKVTDRRRYSADLPGEAMKFCWWV